MVRGHGTLLMPKLINQSNRLVFKKIKTAIKDERKNVKREEQRRKLKEESS